MKRALISLLLFLVVFLCCQCFIPYTLMQQESFALFLTTPDYIRETFSAPWPVSHLVGNFIVQFFHFPYLGPAVLALLVTGIYLLLSIPFHKKALLLYSIVFGIILCSGAVVLGTNDRARRLERLNAVEYQAEHHQWQQLLKIATPQATRHDRSLLPYALLALAETGELPTQLFAYPIHSIDDFYPEGWNDRRGLAFGACLYECMGLTNEAIHKTFQAGDALPHGASFGTLRTLMRLYRQQGNDLLADKYRAILAHSTLHGKHPTPTPTTPCTAATAEQRNDSFRSLLITPDYFYNVTTLIAHGANTPILIDRSLCGLLARRDLAHFMNLWNLLPHPEGEAIPPYYREALLLANPATQAEAQGAYTNYFMHP